jgi:hypothetical protein
MNRFVRALVLFAVPWVVSCGGGGAGGSGSEALTPRGGECGVAPSGECQIDEKRSDEQRFAGLNVLSKQLLDAGHPLRGATLVGGEAGLPIGSHVQTVAVMISTWDIGQRAHDAKAIRRQPGGDLYNIVQRLRCAADRLIGLGASAKAPELVCWSLELWRTARAYKQLEAKGNSTSAGT